MRKNNNTIEINGRRYNASTGAALSGASSAKPLVKPAITKTIAVKQATQSPQTVKAPKHHPARSAAPHNLSHVPAAADTLMRQAVKKPGPGTKRRFRAYGHTDVLVEQPQIAALKPSVKRLDEQRLKHALDVTKSRLISRFPSLTSVVSPDPVKSSAAADTPSPQPTQPVIVEQPGHAVKQSKHPKTTADLLERAIQQATSHQQAPPHKRPNNRAKRNAGIGATVTLAVLLLGVIVSQNLSNIRLQTASAKAGFSASLPDYRPAGYSLGQLDYAGGVVSAQFHSNSDDRRYSLTQQRSAWDSSALRDNFVASAGGTYQTVEASGGRTIYIYGTNNATWVNNGIWYIVQSNGSLSNRQLVEIADSL